MKSIRLHLSNFILLLLVSGITAFPLKTEIEFLYRHSTTTLKPFEQWIEKVYQTINATPEIMFYGTDWLAFGHIIISLFFIPVLLNPQQHKVNLKIGMVACTLVLPLAFICGPVRGIPFFHQLIDCAFGVIGFLYLYFILNKINKLKPQ